MENLFYITQPQEGLYNLRISTNHMCIATGRDLDVILEKVERYTRTFGSPEVFLSEYNELINGFRPNAESIAHYEKMKKEHMYTKPLSGEPCLAELIKDAVERGDKKSGNSLRKRLNKKVEEVQEEPEVKKGLVRPKRKKIAPKVVEEPVKKSGLVRPKRKAVK